MDPYDGEASMEIRQLQERDQDLVKVRSWFSKNKRPPFHKVRNHGYVIKSLWADDLELTTAYKTHMSPYLILRSII